jgi:hypothetical protein
LGRHTDGNGPGHRQSGLTSTCRQGAVGFSRLLRVLATFGQRSPKSALDLSCPSRGGRVAERAMRQRVGQHFQGIDLTQRGGAFKLVTPVRWTLRTAFALNEHEAVREQASIVPL